MKLSEKDHILIEKSISGQLNADEQVSFDARMERDHEFREEVLFHQDLKVASKSLEREGLRQIMREQVPAPIISSNPFASDRYRRILTWAAAAVLLLISAFLFLLPNASSQFSGEELYASYYQPFPNIISPITKGDSTERDVYQIYESGDYHQAIERFNQKNPQMTVDRFYLAMSYIATEDLSAAQELLKKVSSENNDFTIPAKWYLALTYLKQNKIMDGKALFEEISSEDHPMASRAKSLLGQLP